jgi:hypothetical protein
VIPVISAGGTPACDELRTKYEGTALRIPDVTTWWELAEDGGGTVRKERQRGDEDLARRL